MLRIIPCLLLSGCCCCWPFGGDNNGGGGFLEDYVEERLAEELAEAALGAEEVDVGEDGSVTIRTAEGTLEAREGADGGMVITDGDGNVVMSGGDGSTVPDDFPIAPYAGSTVVSTMVVPDGEMVTWQVEGDADAVLAHYRSQLEGMGTVTDAMDMNTGDGRMVMLAVQETNLSVMLTTSPGNPVVVAVTRVP